MQVSPQESKDSPVKMNLEFALRLAVLALILATSGSAWAGSEKVLYRFHGRDRWGGGGGGSLILAVAVTGSASAAPKYKILHAFTGGKDGGGLFGNLLFDASGNLFGTTWGGGKHIYGTVFELSPSSKGRWKETVLYNFCSVRSKRSVCADGAGPSAGLVSDAAGNLFGVAAGGGPSDQGAIFELSRAERKWAYRVLYDIAAPGGLVTDGMGSLYGFIGPGEFKQGAVGELSHRTKGWTYTVLYSFDFYKGDGWTPESGLNFDSNGNLYGTTEFGGSGGFGTAFEVSPPNTLEVDAGWDEHILHQFPAFQGDGQYPYGGLIADRVGNIYGTTESGGNCAGCGIVFCLTRDQDGIWQETILHKFSAPADGQNPMATLVMDGAGNLYGSTAGGGNGQQYCPGGCGVVFKLTRQSQGWKYTVLHRFNGTDGAGPQAALILDSKGNLYGTTQYGGSGYNGVVFEITP